MALNFADIASKKLADVERPPLAPTGTYNWVITKLPDIGEVSSDKGHWDTVKFSVQAISATDDVDPEALQAFGKVNGIRDTLTFMFDKTDDNKFAQTEFQLRRFLEEHVGCATPEMSISEALNASQQGKFAGVYSHRPDKNDPEVKFGQIGKTSAIE